MPTELTGIAILGAGIFAKEAHVPALASLGTSAPPLRAVYSRSLKSAQEVAAVAQTLLELPHPPAVYHDGDASGNLDALLARSDITAVIVVLPITTQPDIVLKALAAGKHVLSEKPVAPDVAQGVKLIKTYISDYKPKGLVWRVAENFELETGFRATGKLIKDGKIGKVLFYNSRIVNYIDEDSKWYKTPWRTVPDYQGGFLLDGGVHFAAALRVLLPSSITHVASYASLNKKYLAPHDTINAIVQSSDGSHGLFELTFAAPTQSRTEGNGVIITGSSGYLSIAQTRVDAKNVLRTTIKTVKQDEKGKKEELQEVIDAEVNGVEAEFEAFFQAVSGKHDDGLGDPKEALKDVAFIQAALTSEGTPVNLDTLITQA